MPAIAALVSVLTTPLMSELSATLATRPPLPGASCDSTPIWMPTDEMLPKPHSAYVAMSRERGERSAYAGSEVRDAN